MVSKKTHLRSDSDLPDFLRTTCIWALLLSHTKYFLREHQNNYGAIHEKSNYHNYQLANCQKDLIAFIHYNDEKQADRLKLHIDILQNKTMEINQLANTQNFINEAKISDEISTTLTKYSKLANQIINSKKT